MKIQRGYMLPDELACSSIKALYLLIVVLTKAEARSITEKCTPKFQSFV